METICTFLQKLANNLFSYIYTREFNMNEWMDGLMNECMYE